jgi:hypothetical protein
MLFAKGTGDFSDLAVLCKSLNKSDFGMIDIDAFVRHLAVESLFSFGDGFTCRGSNYYAVNVGTTTLPYFKFVPHDFDDSFGTKAGLSLSQWAQLSLSTWGQKGVCNDKESFLTLSVMQHPVLSASYWKYVNQLVSLFPAINSKLDSLYTLYEPFVVLDPWFSLDFDGGLDDWYASRPLHFDRYLKLRLISLLGEKSDPKVF